MRVAILTHYFSPEVGAAQARLLRIARALGDAGVEVCVHTGFPSYPTGKVKEPYRNSVCKRDDIDGVPVLRTVIYPAPNRGFARRLAGHAAFAAGAVALAGRSGPADVVLAESPPLFTGGAAIAYARIKRAPLLLSVSDRWPDSAVALGALGPGPALSAARALERACYRAAAAIAVPTAPMARAIEAMPAARGKVEVLAPGVELERFLGVPAVAPRPGAPLRILYAGTVGLAQRLRTLAEAARIAGPEAVEVTIAGEGAELEDLRGHDWTNVRLLGGVDPARVPDLYAEADAGAVLLRDRPLFDEALPTKLLEVMAAGRPVLLSAGGESAALVERAGAGVVVAPEDPAALAAAMLALRDGPESAARMGAAGRDHAGANHGAEVAAGRWVELVSRLAESRRSARAVAARRPSG